MRKQLPAWVALCIIALVAGLLLGVTNELTASRIEEQTLAAADEARKSVLTSASSFTELDLPDGATVDNVYEGKSGSSTVGYTAQITVKGYGGEIEITVGMNMGGAITGVNVGGANFSETAGLGAKAKEPKFTAQFAGVTPPATVGEGIDGLSGATITTGAVVGGVNRACTFIQKQYLAEEEPEEEISAGAVVVEASERGFGGEVTAKVYIDADGTITKVEFSAPDETVGLGSRVEDDEAFIGQFVGKTDVSGVDAISGATVSSQAAISAVKKALEAPREQPSGAGATVAEASERGFGGEITAKVTIDANGAIKKVEFSAPDETVGLGSMVEDDASFAEQFVGKTDTSGIDTISGATVSSQAAISAVKKALEAPREQPSGAGATVVEASERGFGGDIIAKVTLDANGAIKKVEFSAPDETVGLGTRVEDDASFAEQFVGKTDTSGIDTISGATVSSQAAISAVSKAIELAG